MTAPEIPDEIIAAAQKHDRDTRPRGNYQSVPDHQARRLIEGAVAAERRRIRELADRVQAVCTGDEGTSHFFSALLDDPKADGR